MCSSVMSSSFNFSLSALFSFCLSFHYSLHTLAPLSNFFTQETSDLTLSSLHAFCILELILYIFLLDAAQGLPQVLKAIDVYDYLLLRAFYPISSILQDAAQELVHLHQKQNVFMYFSFHVCLSVSFAIMFSYIYIYMFSCIYIYIIVSLQIFQDIKQVLVNWLELLLTII